MTDDDDVLMWYPPADITPSEFEEWAAGVFESARTSLDDITVTIHDRITGTDGAFDFDATVRYRWAGIDFIVIVEAKRHKNPIKRELVQVLHSKMLSVGAHKGVMFSTSGFQRGAVEFAKKHGIALVTVTEGRFLYETRSADHRPALTREEAKDFWNLPTFAGHYIEPGDTPGETRLTLIDTHHPEYVRDLLLSVPTT
jgi:hypothetical protein